MYDCEGRQGVRGGHKKECFGTIWREEENFETRYILRLWRGLI